ncbi:FAD:protein FMN transferase [Rhodococcus spelaei]|uniref:FAD:protein FMN transferase n=1 Tax=Rhodococcus spelaei TaxID=2546320 RepID=A0A541BP23_9NOCA|nr:FAD:protein FMN transferase [Rhodococcus spelaei]TQF74081.1 FAD:protein FMN transferase [Rhodococcus spelaei]
MVPSTQWSTWGSEVEVRVTEWAALTAAAEMVSATLSDVQAVCDLSRGDAEIHAVNLAQGTPVKVSARLTELIRSALWAARMTAGAVSPLSLEAGEVPGTHPAPGFTDVRVHGDTVFAPFGVFLDITGTAKAGTAHHAARVAADNLECGVMVRVDDIVATSGHCPIGGWQVGLGGCRLGEGEQVEVVSGRTMASARAAVPGEDAADGGVDSVTVIAEDGLWAYAAATAALGRGVAALRWLTENDLAARVAYRRGSVRTTDAWSHLCPHGHVA